ncbi:hypothetical protein [uncultured Draconibacterium sp.]|uniref:hypothetical protein n=1 Tax=uncultured Draconibacterium sp. TaxID=1573823 RepID=UPI0025E83A66|nr:hypothetical protein [uncultured Draconibacterium sp.]
MNYAMVYGAEYAQNEILLFINAKVNGLQKVDFEKLHQPIYNNEADIVIGTPHEFLFDFGANPYQEMVLHKAMLKSDLQPLFFDVRELDFELDFFVMLYYQLTGKRMKLVNFKEHSPLFPAIENTKKNTNDKGNEIALTILSNLDLITKRLQNKFYKQENYTRSTISSVQFDLNSKMKRLKDEFCT